MEEKDNNDDASDDTEGEDPTVAAYRKFITQMDQMEKGDKDVDKDSDQDVEKQPASTLKSGEEGGEHASLLLSTLQEEDESLGLDGPGRLSIPPTPGIQQNARTRGTTSASIDKTDPAEGRSSPSDGRTSPLMGRTSPLTGRTSPLTGRTSPLMGRTSSLMGRTSPLTGGSSPLTSGSSPLRYKTSPMMGRTSPLMSGRSSPGLHRGRVSPHLGVPGDKPSLDNYEQPSSEGKTNIHNIKVQPAPEITSNGKKWTENGKVHCRTSDAEGNKPKQKQKSKSKIFVRAFKERASQENFALYGLLTPALCLVPNVDGHDTLTQTFTGLQGEDRELKLAAAHVDDAINGRGKFGKARAFFTSKKGQFCFRVQNNRWFNRLVLVATVIHMLLIFFEPPPVGSTHYFVYVLTPLCLLVYTMDVAVYIGFLSWKVFWTLDENKFIRAEFVFLCMYTVDFLMLVIQEILSMRLFQVFRVLRAAIIICKLKNVGHIFDVVMSIVIKLGKVFLIVLLFIVMFSAVGVHLLEDDYHNIGNNPNCTDSTGDTYVGAFDHLGIASLRLFVLLTTENYPDLLTQAFSVDKSSVFYFIIYILIGVFFLTAILLAIIVDSYWEFAKKHVKKERARERAELAKAWNLLDPLGHGSLAIDDEKLVKLFHILRPQNTDEMNMQLIQYLDENGDGWVDSLEWTIRLNDALGFEFEVEDHFISGNRPKWMNAIKRVAQKVAFSNIFNLIVLILIFIHCILFCVHWYNMSIDAALTVQIFKTVIVSIFMVEVIFRIVSDWRQTLLQVIEVADIALIVAAFVFNIVWYIYTEHHLRNWFSVLSGLAVAFRVGLNSNETKRVVVLFSTKIFPVMFDLIILVCIIVYFYAVLGFEAFHNKSPAENHSSPYCGCGLGFDTFWCSLLAVFQIVTTSNWHELMNSAMISTSNWACVYFVSCYIAINLVVMNLFVAIAIEAFNKLGTEKSEMETQTLDESSHTRGESMADSAKTFINTLFESSRQKELVRSRSKSSGNRSTSSPRMRRTSRAMSTAGLTPMPPVPAVSTINLLDVEDEDEEEEKEEAEDYTGLTPQEKKKKQRKKMMQAKKKKKIPKTRTVVVTAYKGTKDQELDLNVGDEVTVIQKQDDWWEGTIRGKRGWFPGSHVRQVKRNVLSPRGERKEATPSGERPKSPGPKAAWSREETQGTSAPAEPQVPVKEEPKHGLTMHDIASATKHKPRLKLKHTGNWRKEILGDITVINPEELKELNRILKSGTAQASLNSTLGATGALKRKPTKPVENAIEEEEPDHPPSRPKTPISQPKTVLIPPTINVETVATLPLPEEEEDEPGTQIVAFPLIEVKLRHDDESYDESSSDNDTLTVDKPKLPTEVKRRRNKEKAKDGEMPSWMKNFVETNKINVSTDVKVDEAAVPDVQISSDEDTQTFQDGTKDEEKEVQVTEL